MMRPVFGFHRGQRQTRGVEGGSEVDGDNGIPFFYREILNIGHMLYAGIVDQHIDPAELLQGDLHHGGDLRGLAHVGIVVSSFDAKLFFYVSADCIDLRDLAKTIEHDVGAGSGQAAGDS